MHFTGISDNAEAWITSVVDPSAVIPCRSVYKTKSKYFSIADVVDTSYSISVGINDTGEARLGL
jgi:hypothetical protein